jgi:hypothetical protein
MAGNSDLVDVSLIFHAQTAKAILVSETGDETDAMWLPKSQIEFTPAKRGGETEVTLPEWLAIKAGLV